MLAEQFIADLKRAFQERISVKTGWGYLEVQREFDQAMIAALAKQLPEVTREQESLYEQRDGESEDET